MNAKFCKINVNKCGVFHKVCCSFLCQFIQKYSKIECSVSFYDSKTNHLCQLLNGYNNMTISDIISNINISVVFNFACHQQPIRQITSLKNALKFFLMFLFESEADRAWAAEGQRERETQNPKQALGSELSAQSLTWGWNSWTMRPWPQPKSDT